MKRILLASLVVSLALSACGARAAIATVPPLPTLSPVDRQTRVLEALYTAVNMQYLYPDFGGADWSALHSRYQDKIKSGLSNADFEKAMGALVGNLPGGSAVYQTRSERIDQELQNTSLYSGIGAYITFRAQPQPHIVITAIVAGSPAETAGLKAHDSIYSIDGQAVTAAEGLDAVKRIRGQAGTSVTLEVGSPGGARRTLPVQRARLTASDTLQAFLIPSADVAYLRFPVSAGSDLVNQVGGVLQSIAARGHSHGLVLDLRVARDEAGAWPLAEMLTLFGNGPLGAFYSRTGQNPVNVTGVDLGGSQKTPLAILVGPDTQGPPEIFAAALQESGRARVLGLATAGKIFGFTTLPLPDGSRLTLAVSSFKTHAGRDLANGGVTPDVALAQDWDQVDQSNDPVRDRAAQLLAGGQAFQPGSGPLALLARLAAP
jgi:carboxyl-terminal processing protease